MDSLQEGIVKNLEVNAGTTVQKNRISVYHFAGKASQERQELFQSFEF